MFRRSKSLVVSIVVALLIVSGAVAYRVSGAGLPFGGFIEAAFFCSCDGGWLLRVGPPVGGYYVYRNTPQFPFSQLPRPGVWVLGLYEPGATCSYHSGDGCDTRPAQGIITPIVGTSL